MLMPACYREEHVRHRADYFSQPAQRPMGVGLDLYGKRKDGTEFPVDIMLSPLETEGGLFGLSVIRDISERKRSRRKSFVERTTSWKLAGSGADCRTAPEVNEQLRLAATVMQDSNDAITVTGMRRSHPGLEPRRGSDVWLQQR